jgi:hypothetical protein
LPNREYWLEPERRERTLGYLRAHGQVFACAVALFLAYVHWSVVRANQVKPPAMSMDAVWTGLAVFGVVLVMWLGALWWRFRAPVEPQA